jgi:beta-lactamase regulating signal transducer with metallopeptidase domain
MNALGIVLAWTAVQVTLFCLAGTGVYHVARRRASGASVLCGTLIVSFGIAVVAVSPWPRWWTVDLRSVARGQEPAPLVSPGTAETPAARPAEADGTDRVEHEVATFTLPQALLQSASRMWKQVRDEMAESSSTKRLDDHWRWPAWLAALIVSGMVIGLARVLLGMLGLAKLLRETRPVNDPSLLSLIEELRGRLHCRRPMEVREMTHSGGGSPAVVGWRRPIMLLPADWRTWSEEARRGILAHETAHVAHGDYVMWLAAQAGVVVHFYNPLVHWLAGRLRLEQELAADACGAALAGGAKAYADLLAQRALVQDEFRPLWAGRPFFPTRGTLMRRIEMLHRQPIGMVRSPSKTWRALLLTVLVCIGFAVSGLRGPLPVARADDAVPEKRPSAAVAIDDGRLLPSFDRDYLPAEAIAVMSFKPIKVANTSIVVEPTLLTFPMSFGFGFGAHNADKAPEIVEQVTTIVLAGEPGQAPPARSPTATEPCVLEIYRMRKPYERAKLRAKIFGESPDGVTETISHGYACYSAVSDASGLLVNYLMIDDRTLVIVRDRDMPRLLAADAQAHPSWYGEWQKVADRPLAVGFDSAAMDAVEERNKDSVEEVVWSALKQTTHCFGSVDSTADGLQYSAAALCKSSEQAVATAQAVSGALALARLAVPQLPSPAALPKEYQQIDIAGPLVQTLATVRVDATDTQARLAGKLDAAFVASFAEATKALIDRQTEEYKAREQADEQAHVTKLGRLVEAFNIYHAKHGHYPPAAVVGPDGKTLHSWRVELLPYLGEQKLFDEYKLDEPWDSEHNKPLVERIPSIYSTSVWTEKGKTDYFVVTGKGTLFDADAPTRRESISDAAGETILVLQSFQRVPWTQPVDIETAADHKAVRPFRGHGKGFYAAFADGTVKFVSKETDAASVRAMFTKAGGDEVKLR